MPFLAPLAVAAASAWTALGGLTILGISATSILGFVATTALSYGLSAYEKTEQKRKARKQAAAQTASSFGQDIQQIIRQATAPRFRSYGTVKVGGLLSFFEARNGYLYLMTVTGQGTIAGIDEFWINDKQVLLDGVNNVVTEPFLLNGSFIIAFEWRRGLIDQPSSNILQTDFPEWTAAHQLKGLAWTLMRATQVPQDKYQSIYNSTEPTFKQVHRGVLVWDFRDPAQNPSDPNTWQWSNNPIVCLLDYFMHTDGMALNSGLFDFPSFIAAANRCDELVPLASGGAERRYTCSGTYNLDDEPKTIIDGILDSCRGEIRLMPSGRIGVNIASYNPTPAFTILDEHILSYEISRGGQVIAEFNSVKAKYTSPLHDYQVMEAQAFRNEAAVAQFGRELPEDFPIPWVTSFTQARRLAKIELYEDNPDWSGTLTVNAFGLNLLSEWYFRLVLTELGIDVICRNNGVTVGEDLTTVKIEFASQSPIAHQWSTAEEGSPPPLSADTSDNASLVVPTGLRVVTGIRGGVTCYGGVTWNRVTTSGVTSDVRWRELGGDWHTTNTGTNAWYEFSPLTLGHTYEVNVRHVNTAGNVTTWTAITFVATDDQTPPGIPTDFQVSPGVESATIQITNSTAPQAWAVQVQSVPQGAAPPNFSAPIAVFWGGPGETLSGTVSQPSGPRDFYARCVAITNQVSSPIGPITATIQAPPPPATGTSGDNGNGGGGTDVAGPQIQGSNGGYGSATGSFGSGGGNGNGGGWGSSGPYSDGNGGGFQYDTSNGGWNNGGGNGGNGGQQDNSGDVGNNTPGGYW